MIFGAEIGLLVLGFYALVTGKLVLGKGRVVLGVPARLLALVACAPIPLSFTVILAYTRGRVRDNPADRWPLIALEGGILLACVAVIYAIGWTIAESPDTDAGAEPEEPEEPEARSIPTASRSNLKAVLVALGLGVAAFFGGLLISGVWSNDSALQSNETPDSDVNEIPPAPPIAGPVPASLMPADWQPRVDRMLKWNRGTLAGAYDKVGKKSPKWDEHARAAMELTALYFSNTTDPRAQPKDIRAATQKALDAGCDDPLILYLHARSADPETSAAELDRGFAKAAKAMQSSAYPPMRRSAALWQAAKRYLKRKGERDAKAEALRLIVAAVQMIPASAREDERCRDLEGLWYERSRDALAAYKQLGYDPQESWRFVDTILATEKPLEATRLLLKGDFFIKWAWDARGSGYAHTVTREGEKLFNHRLTIAREALEKSLQLAPHYGQPATFMLTVELGQSRGRAEMEKWFELAIEFSPSVNVCGQKLEWLHPKWYGSIEEMLAFGRACRDSENWAREYPLIMVETHQRIADMQSSDGAKSAYFRRPDVVADILYVYGKSLECYPNDVETRSRYAYYCYLCGHPRRAHAQFERVGDKLWWNNIFTEKLMKQTRAKAAKEAGEIRP